MSFSLTNFFLLIIFAILSRHCLRAQWIDRCRLEGDSCQNDDHCCSNLICSATEDGNLCISDEQLAKRSALDHLIIPPYYNPKNHLYPYGSHLPPFPFHHVVEDKISKTTHRNRLEWDHCRYHEDCGEGNCCYVHFRFRSLPKSFCRPNRNPENDLCEPLARYRSLKDVPAWKKQREFQMQNSSPISQVAYRR